MFKNAFERKERAFMLKAVSVSVKDQSLEKIIHKSKNKLGGLAFFDSGGSSDLLAIKLSSYTCKIFPPTLGPNGSHKETIV